MSTERGEDGETITQATSKTTALNSLVQKIELFRDRQERLMLLLHATLTAEERTPDRSSAQCVSLWLPSDLGKDDYCGSPGLRALEIRL